MEFFSLLLSGLFGLVMPFGFVVDRVAENTLRSQLYGVERLEVRVDNAPSHNILGGKVDQVWMSGRGLSFRPSFRVDTLELETDEIGIDPASLSDGPLRLSRPFQAAVKIVLTERDINRALQAPEVADQLRTLVVRVPAGTPAQREIRRYNFFNPQVKLLANDRVQLQVELREQEGSERLTILAESTLQVVSGSRLQLIDPKISVDGQEAPAEILDSIAKGISAEFDLLKLESTGITARVLKFEVTPQQMLIATFVRIEPEGLANLNLK